MLLRLQRQILGRRRMKTNKYKVVKQQTKGGAWVYFPHLIGGELNNSRVPYLNEKQAIKEVERLNVIINEN